MCIGASCGAVASTHFGGSKQWTVATFWINFVTLMFFGLDVFVQFIPDPAAYVHNVTSIFDFLITALGAPLDLACMLQATAADLLPLPQDSLSFSSSPCSA